MTSPILPAEADFKAQARRLHAHLTEHGSTLNYAQCLDALSRAYGHKSWQHARVQLTEPSSAVSVDTRKKQLEDQLLDTLDVVLPRLRSIGADWLTKPTSSEPSYRMDMEWRETFDADGNILESHGVHVGIGMMFKVAPGELLTFWLDIRVLESFGQTELQARAAIDHQVSDGYIWDLGDGVVVNGRGRGESPVAYLASCERLEPELKRFYTSLDLATMFREVAKTASKPLPWPNQTMPAMRDDSEEAWEEWMQE